MAIKFGRIDYSENTFGETTFNKNQTVTSASEGVSLIHLREDDRVNNDSNKVPDSPFSISGSHWSSMHSSYYLSGSHKVASSNPDEVSKFNSIYHSFNQFSDLRPFHKNKFHDTGSVIYIPQQYFGERIKSGSFELTARTGSSTNTTNQIIIRDDGNGNLFCTNSTISHSGVTPISSSDNYVGNIYYDLGVVVLTETASVFHTTPSTASITYDASDKRWAGNSGSNNSFFISSSALGGESIQFKSTGSFATETDTDTLFHFFSGSNNNITTKRATNRINTAFNGTPLTASYVSSNALTITNNARLMDDKKITSREPSYPPISASGAFSASLGQFNSDGTSDVRYVDIGRTDSHESQTYKFWSMDFNSVTPIYTSQYTIKIAADQFNNSINASTRKFYFASGSFSLPAGADITDYINLRNNLTGSGWSPYFTQINLFKNQEEEALITCNLPRAIKKRDDIDLIITFRMDH